MSQVKQNAYELLAFGGKPGEIHISNTQELKFLEALVRCSIVQQCNQNLDFVFGYRYGRFVENLEINDLSHVLAIPVRKNDLFNARNEFNGFEMGFVSTTRYCRWSLDVLGKLAVGSTHSQVNVSGATSVNDAPFTPGGLLALPTNSPRTVEQNNFSAIPELGLTLGYDLTCRVESHLRIHVRLLEQRDAARRPDRYQHQRHADSAAEQTSHRRPGPRSPSRS